MGKWNILMGEAKEPSAKSDGRPKDEFLRRWVFGRVTSGRDVTLSATVCKPPYTNRRTHGQIDTNRTLVYSVGLSLWFPSLHFGTTGMSPALHVY